MSGQKVGVVLSGGGAAGLAHIGVLKALEDNGVPIDHITGSSIGALVGGLYAAGYSPAELDSLFRTELFQLMAEGGIEDRYKYHFMRDQADGSWVQMKVDLDTSLQASLPTNLRSPALMDYEQMRALAPVAAMSGYDMDSLFVPFRCVASDITNKQPVIFDKGDLALAVRASISYPFYFKPIRVDGNLMMDGGLYNNFPADVMYNEFFPDVIIGSNVGTVDAEPSEDDLLSQLRAMLVERTLYEIPCENGIIIEPEVPGSIFDFSNPAQAVEAGYTATLGHMTDILQTVRRRKLPQQMAEERKKFNSFKPALVFQSVHLQGLSSTQQRNVERTLRLSELPFSAAELKPHYFQLLATKNIRSIHPKATYDRSSGKFDLDLQIKKEKALEVRFGGIFSSRPISGGYAALRYNMFDKASSYIEANSYFGKFYTSVQAKYRLDISGKRPIAIEPVATVNRWDYFRSFNSFFLDERPAFIVMRDSWAGLNMSTPLGNKGLLRLDGKLVENKNAYYQTDNFTNKDTSDITVFSHVNTGILLERNSLNKKQHASEGEHLMVSLRYVNGEESTTPGSTTQGDETVSIFHDWIQLKAKLEKYFLRRSNVKFGLMVEGVYSSMPFFQNFKATVIQAPAFRPTPEISGFFIEDLRALQYIAGGARAVFEVYPKVDLRLEGYVFQPYEDLEGSIDGETETGLVASNRYYIGSGSLVYHSPLGPLWFNTSYLDGLKEPWVVSVNFGYLLFNQSSME
jgi:NTE family protein